MEHDMQKRSQSQLKGSNFGLLQIKSLTQFNSVITFSSVYKQFSKFRIIQNAPMMSDTDQQCQDEIKYTIYRKPDF